jgi:hypothetical protein
VTEPDPSSAEGTCPWCSTRVAPGVARCPNCGAALHEEDAVEIPGVTQVDPRSAALHDERPPTGGIIGWLSGEYAPDPTDAERASVEPPSAAVQQEMIKLEVRAIQAELEAREHEREVDERGAANADGTGPRPAAPPPESPPS